MQKEMRLSTMQLMAAGIFLLISIGCEKEKNNALTVTDIDGNVYHTVTIGSQVWMVENLKTTRYNDGTGITKVTDSADWNSLVTPAYCWMNNDSAGNKEPYGALYNWYAVNSDNLCPEGWHVPTTAEWETLIDYLGGIETAGGKLKESGIVHWSEPNAGASNSSGFTALPGGCRVTEEQVFLYYNFKGYWWTSTPEDADYSWWWSMDYSGTNVTGYYIANQYGFSVRCIQDGE
jgi:uncharacterized protein (TIGR02145 family)